MTSLKALAKAFLERREEALASTDYPMDHAPIFIVAPPRSGSTLLYQCMITAFRVCYISNGMQRFPYCPILFTKTIGKSWAFSPPSGYASRFGHTRGFRAPSDGHAVWKRWFPDSPQYLEPDSVDDTSLQELRQTIAGIQHFAGTAFVNKSQRNTLRASVIHQAIPEALFVRLRRSYPELILSLYKAHLAHREGDWFSVRPREYDRILETDSLIERAVLHAAYAEIDLDDQLNAATGARVMDVVYEDLCDDTGPLLDRIRTGYESADHRLETRRQVPSSFPRKSSSADDARELYRIEEYMEKHADLFAHI